MVNHSNILAWRIPWTEEPGRLGSQRVRLDWVPEHAHMRALKVRSVPTCEMVFCLHAFVSPSIPLIREDLCVVAAEDSASLPRRILSFAPMGYSLVDL